jgi:GH35 family endo-1,4-beta-xylanase
MNLNRQKIDTFFRFFDHPEPGINERIESDINRYRKGWSRITVTSEGKPVEGLEISLKLLRHDFNFGGNAFKFHDFRDAEKNAAYEDYFKRVFNLAVLPFYWNTYEPAPGKYCVNAEDQLVGERRPATEPLLEWCETNGIRPKGHVLFMDMFNPAWLPDDWRAIMRHLDRRLHFLGETFGRRIDIWDVVNESSFSQPRSADQGVVMEPDFVRKIFKMAERYFPGSTEFVYNDGTLVNWVDFAGGSSPMYLLLKDLINRGSKVDSLGMQFHMRQLEVPQPEKAYSNSCNMDCFFNPARLLEAMDFYGRLNLPLHVSEISFPVYRDIPAKLAAEVQAKMLRNYYRMWFSQKDCSSIVYWNLCDNTAFGDENDLRAGLIDAEFQEKPAYKMLDTLVNREWRTETSGVTDTNGILDWNGFYGQYELSINGEKSLVDLTPRGKNRIFIRDGNVAGAHDVRGDLLA